MEESEVTEVLAIAPDGAPPLSPYGPSPQAVSSLRASIDYRDVVLAARLRAISFRGTALRAAWAMQRLCNEAEKRGIDVSYWRTLAAETEAKVS